MPRALSGRKPRRYKDHRTREARRWAESYSAIAERYPPKDALARKLIALCADIDQDYARLRSAGKAAQKKQASPIRKTAGLFLATLRILGGGGNGQREPEDIAAALARLRREDEV